MSTFQMVTVILSFRRRLINTSSFCLLVLKTSTDRVFLRSLLREVQLLFARSLASLMASMLVAVLLTLMAIAVDRNVDFALAPKANHLCWNGMTGRERG